MARITKRGGGRDWERKYKAKGALPCFGELREGNILLLPSFPPYLLRSVLTTGEVHLNEVTSRSAVQTTSTRLGLREGEEGHSAFEHFKRPQNHQHQH